MSQSTVLLDFIGPPGPRKAMRSLTRDAGPETTHSVVRLLGRAWVLHRVVGQCEA